MLLLMRVIHILGGVAWAGGSFVTAGFVEPTAKALGPEGGRFMQHVTGPGRLSMYLSISAVLNTLSGIYLYSVRSGGFRAEWMTTGEGLTLTIGALAGLVAAVYGGAVTSRTAVKLGKLGQQLAAAGGPPKPEQLAAMGDLQNKLAQSGRIGSLLLLIAVIGMSLSGHG
jgi:uncharacterized membrane protein